MRIRGDKITYMNEETVVACYRLDGTLKKVYSSAFDASKKMHISRGSIYDCIKGRKKSFHGYMWRRFPIDEDVPLKIEPYCIPTKESAIRVSQYTFSGELVETFSSISEAAKKLKVNISAIGKCVRGEFKSIKGYFFIKEGDTNRLNFLMNNNTYFYKEIHQLDLDGKTVKKYPSIQEASKATGIAPRTIGQSIRKHSKTQGHYWVGIK